MKSISKFFQLYKVLVVIVFIAAGVAVSGGSVFSDVFQPIVVKPYDEDSLRRLEKSYASLESNLGKLESVGKTLEMAADACDKNPTERNQAVLVEKIGQSAKTSIESLNNSITLLDNIQPEINSYKEYLKKLNRDMHNFSDNPLYADFASWYMKEIDDLGEFMKELEMVKNDLKDAREIIAAETNVWIANRNIKDTLAMIIPGGKMGKFFKGMTQFFKPLTRIKTIIDNQVKKGALQSHEDYESEIDEYREAKDDFFGNSL
jgi:hypothetical protein